MTKLIKMEDGTYINMDKIVFIEKTRYYQVFGNKPAKNDDGYTLTLQGAKEDYHTGITKKDLDNILEEQKYENH